MEEKVLSKKEIKRNEYLKMKKHIKTIKGITDEKAQEVLENDNLTKTEKERELDNLYFNEEYEIKKARERYRKKYPIKLFPIITISLFLFVVLMTGTNVVYQTLLTGYWNNYEDYVHLTDKNMFDSKNNGESYYIYIYGANCGACESIKSKVIDYAERGGYKLYFLSATDYSAITGDKTECVGKSSFSECTIQYTPTLLFIENGVCTFCTYGSDSVVDKLEGKM